MSNQLKLCGPVEGGRPSAAPHSIIPTGNIIIINLYNIYCTQATMLPSILSYTSPASHHDKRSHYLG